jgi:hypothetical protein
MSIDNVGQLTTEIDRVSLPEQETKTREPEIETGIDIIEPDTDHKMVEILGKWPRSILAQFDKRVLKYGDESEISKMKKLDIAIKMDSQYKTKREKCRIKAAEQRDALKQKLKDIEPRLHSNQPETADETAVIKPIETTVIKPIETTPRLHSNQFEIPEMEKPSLSEKINIKSKVPQRKKGARSLFSFTL